jgi:hypothetical protein
MCSGREVKGASIPAQEVRRGEHVLVKAWQSRNRYAP